MRSNDLARIAGVSIKTLRHYHKVGVLPEPGRDDNNYRSYGARHLARLLRIRRLSALGLSLDEVRDVLGVDGDRAEVVLASLDRELSEQVDRLNRKRALIADLRAAGNAPDIPLELGRFYALFAAFPEKAREAVREHLALLALVVGDAGMPLLVTYLERFLAPDLIDGTRALSERFYLLGPDSPAGEIDSLVADQVAVYAKVSDEFAALVQRPKTSQKTMLIFEHLLSTMNPQQREAFVRIVQGLSDVRREISAPPA